LIAKEIDELFKAFVSDKADCIFGSEFLVALKGKQSDNPSSNI
jgi:hypothetical protein